MFRGPVSGRSEPGIGLVVRGPRGEPFPRSRPQLVGRRTTGTYGPQGKLHRLHQQRGLAHDGKRDSRRKRVDFSGDLTVRNPTRSMHGVGYLMIDDTYLLFALGMDFGSRANSSISKLENSLKTITRPGYTGATNPWSKTGSVASSANRPAMGAETGPPGFPGSGPGSAGYPASRLSAEQSRG